MDFFKSVFADDPEISDTENAPTSMSNSQSQPESPNPNPDVPAITNAWTFGSSLFRTIASKSESVVQNYRRDFEEFSSSLKKETATMREVASRAVKDLPARFESGAAVAQESLESVGQAIDNIGSTVSDIIAHGKESILDNDSDSELSENSRSLGRTSSRSLGRTSSLEQNLNLNAKPYSRIDATIRAIQCDAKTYCDEPDDMIDYNEWKLGFVLEEMNGEIEDLIKENGVIDEIYSEVVPSRADQETFWRRYFYKVYRIRKADEARARLVKRAISGEEEGELSWDVEDEDNEDTEGSNRVASENVAKEEVEKKMDSLQVEDRARRLVSSEEEETALETTSDGGDDKGILAGRVDDAESRGDKGSSEGKNDNSDFSVVSSQVSSHEGDDLGWDEIEDVASGDEIKVPERMSPNKADLRKCLSATEDEHEEESWDIEDEDDEAAKS